MSGKRHAGSGAVRQRWSEKAYASTPLMRHAPLISEAEMTARILRVRAEEAPLLCPTCGSTTPEVIERKVCSKCHADLPMSAFHRDRTVAGGRTSECKACRNARGPAVYRKRVLRAVGIAS